MQNNRLPQATQHLQRAVGAYDKYAAAWTELGRVYAAGGDMVEQQQGDRDVNILSDYKVSANGSRLTLIELRSTRNRPITYVFTRAE